VKPKSNALPGALAPQEKQSVLIGEPGCRQDGDCPKAWPSESLEGNVPQTLENKRVVTLDMASLVAGTKYAASSRTPQGRDDRDYNSTDVIIFIDELHTDRRRGGAEGFTRCIKHLQAVAVAR